MGTIELSLIYPHGAHRTAQRVSRRKLSRIASAVKRLATFLLSGSALPSPVRESDLFCPMVHCCGDMVSIKAVKIHGAERSDSNSPWYECKSWVYPVEIKARVREGSMVDTSLAGGGEGETLAQHCVVCESVWALFVLRAASPGRLKAFKCCKGRTCHFRSFFSN